VCQHWDSEHYFCSRKERTVNPDELSDCAQTCPDYMPRRKSKTVTCNRCGTEFEPHENEKVKVKNREYDTCPVCGVGLERDDETLSKGIE